MGARSGQSGLLSVCLSDTDRFPALQITDALCALSVALTVLESPQMIDAVTQTLCLAQDRRLVAVTREIIPNGDEQLEDGEEPSPEYLQGRRRRGSYLRRSHPYLFN